MISGKKLAVIGGAEIIGIAVAAVNDYPTISIAIIGIGGALATAGVGIYSAYRAARHKADLEDAPLAQSKLVVALQRIAELERLNLEWQRLYDAQRAQNLELGADLTTPPNIPRRVPGATPDLPRAESSR